MEITATIPHPSLTDFATTITYMDRAAAIRKQSQILRSRKPVVVRNEDGTPFLHNGEPLVVFKTDLPDDYAITSTGEYVKGWSGLSLDGAEVPYTVDNLRYLFDERLDVEVEKEVDGKAKKLKISWAMYLSEKALDRATFDKDSKTNGSAKQ